MEYDAFQTVPLDQEQKAEVEREKLLAKLQENQAKLKENEYQKRAINRRKQDAAQQALAEQQSVYNEAARKAENQGRVEHVLSVAERQKHMTEHGAQPQNQVSPQIPPTGLPQPAAEYEAQHQQARQLEQESLVDYPEPAQQVPQEMAEAAQPVIQEFQGADVEREGEDKPTEEDKRGVPKGGHKFLTKGASKSWKQVARSLWELESEGIGQQKELADKLRKQLDLAEKSPEKIDFRAFGMLADAWTGSNMTAQMTDPNAPRTKKIINLQARLQKAVGDLGGMEMAKLRTKLNTAFQFANMESQEARAMMREQGADQRARLAASGSGQTSDYFKEYNRLAGKSAAQYKIGGGRNLQVSNLKQLESAMDDLAANPKLVGKYFDNEYYTSIVNPKTKAFADKVRGVVQQNMKETLGSQFTAKEAEAMMNRALDIKLTPQQNQAKMQAFHAMMRDQIAVSDAAVKWAEEHNGRMEGFSQSPHYIDLRDKHKGVFRDAGGGSQGGAAAEMRKRGLVK